MANLTINQLERFTELAMDYAAAISSGSVTNSATLQQIMDKFLSAQAGNAGKFLTTDGTNASWQAPLPDQTGQNGKFLTTNGTAASWGTVDLSPYEVTANKAQDLTSPSATTYPSTQAVVNESNRIISIMKNITKGIVGDSIFYVQLPGTTNDIYDILINTGYFFNSSGGYNATTNVTFPKAFAANNYAIATTVLTDNSSDETCSYAGYSDKTASGCTLHYRVNGNALSYIAIGAVKKDAG